MTIHSIAVTNFKGIDGETKFDIRPITIFVGPNSSGKSSCLHAIASLTQTIKLGNSLPALILDDEYAQVHLGRFIEIAHSKKYTSAIKFRVDFGAMELPGAQGKIHKEQCIAEYSFKCNKRTDEIYLNEAKINFGQVQVSFKKDKESEDLYDVKIKGSKITSKAIRKSNFFFQLKHLSELKLDDDIGEGKEEKVTKEEKEKKEKEEKARQKEWIGMFFLIESVQNHVEKILRKTHYLGPFRQAPLRRYPFRGTAASEVGAQGEATITILASEIVQSSEKLHFAEINKWLSDLGLAKTVGVKRVGSSDLFDVSLTLHDNQSLPIADLGYGLSQVLPVLTQCSFAPEEATLLFEQPELHLHEGAARKLANIFVETSQEKKAHIIIETHSKELINEVFNCIRNNTLSVDDLAIYSVHREDGHSVYNKLQIEIEEDGYVEVSDPWVNGLVN